MNLNFFILFSFMISITRFSQVFGFKLNKNRLFSTIKYSTIQNTDSSNLIADVCIIGGGHAGCEAAAASARTGFTI